MIAFFFFFTYDKNLCEFDIIKNAFYKVFGKKLYIDFYCNMEKYLGTQKLRTFYKNSLKECNSPIANLFEIPNPKEEDAANVFQDFEAELIKNEYVGKSYSLTFQEAEAIVYWVYHVYSTVKRRKEVTKEALESFSTMFGTGNLDFACSVLYVKDKVEIHSIRSISEFCDETEQLTKNAHTYFYRGHANLSYQLIPSIMRKKQWIEYENDMYNELRIECSNDFVRCSTHLDYLVEMQHYGMPTRLLDVTKNPLVALYFACESEMDSTGEVILFDTAKYNIKYPGSDVVTILSSLPLLSCSEKQRMLEMINNGMTDKEFNEQAVALLHEIKLEKPAFRDEIKKEDIGRAVFVLSEKKNNRIIKQDGAFIVCGLYDEKQNPINNYRYKKNGKIQVFTIVPKFKIEILRQLNKFSINKATLFPEIEDVATYIKNKY